MIIPRNLVAGLVALAAVIPTLATGTVAYRIRPDVESKTFRVSIQIDHPSATETFQIPGWSPGYYVMEHYESKIGEVHAVDQNGSKLAISKPDALTWKVTASANHSMTLSYKVEGDDVGLGFFGASVKSNEAYTNGPASFMYIVGRRTEDVTVHMEHPSGWKVATAMDEAGPDRFTAADYDEMADDPIQMGTFSEKKFLVRGIPFRAVFVAPPGEDNQMNVTQQSDILQKVSEPAVDLFGGAPFKQYIYFFHLSPQGFQGGLEHRSGTVIAIPNSNDNDLSDLAAHEFFHAWNVKQIRPVLLGPFDYTTPQRTGNLWFAEGVTDYYSKVLTYRSKVHDLSWLLDELTKQVDTYQAGKTRLTKTVEDASRAVWEHGGFDLGDLDYYNKGLLAGLIFDAKIREVTGGTKSLDDVMRLMYVKYRLPNAGYPEDGIKAALSEVAGADLAALYDSMIRTTKELPYDALAAIGLKAVSPKLEAQIALGFPIPTENAYKSDLTQFGLTDADSFVNFVFSATPEQAKANFIRDGVTRTVELPLTNKSFPTWQVIVDPRPKSNQAERFVEWAHR